MVKFKRLAQITSVILISSTLANAGPSVDDYAAMLQAPTASAPVQVQQKQDSGWFSSLSSGFSAFRDNVGSALNWVGDQVRTKETLDTDVSRLRNLLKETAGEAVKAKTGVTVTESMMNGFGNAIRWVGGKIGATDAGKSLTSMIMDAGHMHATSKTQSVMTELSKISAAVVKSKASSDTYVDLVNGLEKRGHNVKDSAYNMYAEAVAKDLLQDKQLLNNETAAKVSLTKRLTAFLERIGVANAFSDVQQYVSDLYTKVKNRINWALNH